MSDNQWQAPTGPAESNNQGAFSSQAPYYGSPATAPANTEPGQNATYSQDSSTAWTPPPKPGLIPLRPMELGTILGAAFRTIRRNPKPTFGISILIQGIVWILTNVALIVPAWLSLSSLQFTEDAESLNAILSGATLTLILTASVSVFFSIAATSILQGIIVIEVSRGALGEKLTLRGLWRIARGRILALVGWGLLAATVYLVVVAIIVGFLVLIYSVTGGTTGIWLVVLLGFFAFLGLVVLAAWINTKLLLVPSILVLERLKLWDAVVRSWRLTNGYFWKVFGINLLVTVILSFASGIITGPISLIFALVTQFMAPLGTDIQTVITIQVISYIVQSIVTLIVSSITAIIQTATIALLYLDIRMRKEGLDLILTKYVERVQAGETELSNPYLKQSQSQTA
ncbi:MAG: hypothetical protein IT191_04910 [Microbacteriaceae bacterium]|nr:hypothetical protein [Cryobacterium sp.]MCC6376339.1 hypothetical protein [Microbacteriaceae bacterium]